ncbi:MAG: response regulator [Lachnospiraceae bacterium]|nr:response regulator [Lachnospiraceae bacterium]
MKLDEAKILVSDDSILSRKQLKDTIAQWGSPTFVEAANGQEAIEKFKAEKPDLTFLDIVMPVLDGIGAVEGIIAEDSSANIVIVSSVGTQAQLKKAIEAGAKDFIQKPLNADQLRSIIAINFEI